MNHPLLLLLLTGAGVYVARLWRNDRRAAKLHPNTASPLPGATPAPARAVGIAVAGALLLLALETAGEVAFGIWDQQTRITGLFAVYSIVSAPVIEEIIFRGWLVLEHRGRAALWAAAVATSLAFALLHPFLWHWNDAGFALTPNAKGAFSTAVLFATSLWLYTARFAPWNPHRSLLPCFAAHAAKNAGVVLIKAATGYVSGWW